MLNGIGIGLQPLHMAVQPCVFLLEILDLPAKFMVFDALLLKTTEYPSEIAHFPVSLSDVSVA